MNNFLFYDPTLVYQNRLGFPRNTKEYLVPISSEKGELRGKPYSKNYPYQPSYQKRSIIKKEIRSHKRSQLFIVNPYVDDEISDEKVIISQSYSDIVDTDMKVEPIWFLPRSCRKDSENNSWMDREITRRCGYQTDLYNAMLECEEIPTWFYDLPRGVLPANYPKRKKRSRLPRLRSPRVRRTSIHSAYLNDSSSSSSGLSSSGLSSDESDSENGGVFPYHLQKNQGYTMTRDEARNTADRWRRIQRQKQWVNNRDEMRTNVGMLCCCCCFLVSFGGFGALMALSPNDQNKLNHWGTIVFLLGVLLMGLTCYFVHLKWDRWFNYYVPSDERLERGTQPEMCFDTCAFLSCPSGFKKSMKNCGNLCEDGCTVCCVKCMDVCC